MSILGAAIFNSDRTQIHFVAGELHRTCAAYGAGHAVAYFVRVIAFFFPNRKTFKF